MEEECIVLTKEGSKNGSGYFPVKVENVDGKTIRDFRRDPSIAAVAPAVPMQLVVPVRNKDKLDPINNQSITWGVKAVGADTSPNTGKGIIVAVLDSGIKASHPAFHGIDIVEKDFTEEGNGDPDGHGTHCAGTIFGRDTNGMRIGVATGVEKALVGKVIGEQGGPSSGRVCEAIQWAFDSGANIISMSLSFDFPRYVKSLHEEIGFSLEASVSRALQAYRENLNLFENLTSLLKQQADESQRGLIIVAAGGNETRRLYESSSEEDSPVAREKRMIDKTSFGKKRLLRRFYEVEVGPPGIIENIISVGALGIGARGLRVAEFSNTSADISAPGVEIISASLEGGLESKSGTSMAAPHVAGVAALWAEKLKKDGQLTSHELASRILGTATEQSLEAGFDPPDVGMGLVFAPQDEK